MLVFEGYATLEDAKAAKKKSGGKICHAKRRKKMFNALKMICHLDTEKYPYAVYKET